MGGRTQDGKDHFGGPLEAPQRVVPKSSSNSSFHHLSEQPTFADLHDQAVRLGLSCCGSCYPVLRGAFHFWLGLLGLTVPANLWGVGLGGPVANNQDHGQLFVCWCLAGNSGMSFPNFPYSPECSLRINVQDQLIRGSPCESLHFRATSDQHGPPHLSEHTFPASTWAL